MPWRPRSRDDFPTLGWGVLEHMAKHLPSPADPSEPFILTDEQARIVLRWYELDPRTGEFVHRRGRLEMAKGWGKSPLLAAIAIEEFAGPTVFAGWNAAGEPEGVRPHWPIVEIAAVSEDQTDNTYSVLYQMLTANENAAAKALHVNVGRTRLYLDDGPGELRPVTAEAPSRTGARLTFAVLDETHLWLRRNGGVRLASVLRLNAGKMGGRTFETTNAPMLGEKSVAEESSDSPAPGVLHVARRPAEEPSLDWPESKLRETLRHVYGDAHWAPIDRILAEIADPATSWEDALRFYFNVRNSGASHAVDAKVWDALAKPREVPRNTRIGLGFDGSVSDDATVLRACTADGYRFTVEAWVRPTGPDLARWREMHPGQEWRVPRDEVRAAIDRAFATWSVGRFLADPPKWDTEIIDWKRDYGEDIVDQFDTNQKSKFAKAVDRWRTANATASATHDGDPVVTDHVKAARLEKVRTNDPEDDGRTLYALVKGEDRRKIDGAIADVLALEAAMTMAGEALAEPWVVVR